MTVILGVDPGLGGAVATWLQYGHDSTSGVLVWDMPTFGANKNRGVDGATLAGIIEQMKPSCAFVEKVSAMRGWGSGSVFRFGAAFGTVLGVLGALSIPVHLVTPQKWKKALGLSSDKEDSRRRAIELFPQDTHYFARKMDDGRAESALIAYYGSQQLLKAA